ncbi:canonical poly(A) RNA polymerase PAPD7 [Seminavis robusta]|uniref:Canonical poly(A) RNA polymerase PAPD7 n=1 Tax=Seminavis robusta TaxID=568900 RepID=A0A9N8HHF7_9STRA|nr:canonical poly(A) RNA polymerase PAPD7 [Seminavis robusta]|eukprot:Sro560_g166650.1 canonical poly(A) RNA polymerase PAPD7 (494) ;mRNA; f:16724-18296
MATTTTNRTASDDDDDDSDMDEAEDFLAFDDNNSNKEPKEETKEDDDDDDGTPSDLPPWMDYHTNVRRVTPLVALHNEIVGFCNLMSPMPEEMEQRKALVERFKVLAHKVFGKEEEEKCQVVVFGSQATGLFLPTSDIDIVLQLPEEEQKKKDEEENADNNSADSSKPPKEEADDNNSEGDDTADSKPTGESTDNNNNSQEQKGENNIEEPPEGSWKDMREKSPLDRLADALREEWIDELSYLEVLSKTKVPLVKFTHGPTNLSVDVSFSFQQKQETGPGAATLIKTLMEAMPPLRPLIFVLKYFLKARVLNEPYSGGVGSYMLQLMIVSFLQHRERDAVTFGKPGLYNLGCLLVEFFDLYGTKFNYPTTGLSVRHDGAFFRKGERKEAFLAPNRVFSIAVENPLDITMDVGRASFRYNTVQRSFAAAYKVLLAHVANPAQPTVSILGTILPPSDEMMARKRAKKTSSALTAARGGTGTDGGDSPQRKKRRFR